MKVKQIIENIKKNPGVTVMSANECVDFGLIIEEIEAIVGISVHGIKQVKALENLEKLIWQASKEYHTE